MSSVSVVIPVYNGSRWAESIIETIRGNKEEICEVILINDGDKADFKLLLNKLRSEFGKTIKEMEAGFRTGPGNARNIGLDFAKSEMVAFLDCDDRWCVGSLKKRLELLCANPCAPFVFSSYQRINENGLITNVTSVPNKIGIEQLFVTNFIATPSVVLRKNRLKGTRFKKRGHEDYDFWLRLLKVNNTSAYGLTEPLVFVQTVRDSLSSKKGQAARWHYEILTDFNVPVLLKWLLFSGYALNGWLKRRQRTYRPLFFGVDKLVGLWLSQ